MSAPREVQAPAAQAVAQDRLDLSPREMQILYMTVMGRTRKEIAAQLRLSLHTVDAHRRSLFGKVRVGNSTLLIRHAILSGWVRMPDAGPFGATARAARPASR